MPNNFCVPELIDVFQTPVPMSDPKFGLFLVMEYVESDLRKLILQASKINL